MLTMKDILAKIDESLSMDLFSMVEEIAHLRVDVEEQVKRDQPIKLDVSQSNPKLHQLYVSWAMQHLLTINAFIDRLDDFSSLNMLDMSIAVRAERAKLIDNNTAYRDAAARLMAGHELAADNISMNDFDTASDVPLGSAPGYEGNVNVGSVEDDGDLEDGVIYVFIISDEDVGGIMGAL